MRFTRGILGAALFLATSAPLPAGAQGGKPIIPSSPPIADVGAFLDRAQAAADRRDMQGAYEAYKAAWALQQSYDIAGNLGSVELNLDHYADAAEHLAWALESFPRVDDPSQRRALESQRGVLERKLATAIARVGRLSIGILGPSTELTINGKPRTLLHDPQVFYVEPGRYVVEAAHHGRRASTTPVEVKAGQVVEVIRRVGTVRVTLSPADARVTLDGEGLGAEDLARDILVEAGPHELAATRRAYQPTHVQVDVHQGERVEQPVKLRRDSVPLAVGGSLAGAAVIAGVAGTMLAVLANGKRADFDARGALLGSGPVCAGTPAPSTEAQCQALKDDALAHDTLNKAALGSFVAGGALAIGAAAVLGVWATGGAPDTTGRRSGVRVAPLLGQREAGVLIGGAW